MTGAAPQPQAKLTEKELQTICNRDRLLPSQAVLSKYFEGAPEEFYPHLETLLHSVLPVKSVEEKWKLTLKPGTSYASLGSDLTRLHFYQLLIRMGGFTRVLELGTFVGVSTLFLAEAVGEKGKVKSIEIGKEFYDLAKANIERNGYDGRIELVLGDAVRLLPEYAAKKERYDMILMDAAKENYAAMLKAAVECLAPGGLLLVDDIFINGDALNPAPRLEQGRSVQALLKRLPAMKMLSSSVILPIGNGLLLCHKER